MRGNARTWLVIVMALVIAGCGAESSTSSDEIERLEKRVQDAEREAEEAQAAADDAQQSGEPAESSEERVEDEPVEEESAEEQAEDTSGCINVPNVVGKDHQLAQDTMQAAGLYMLMEEDASGQGRMLLLDRNWTTVRQRPKAGKCVDEGTEIMLYAVKDDER